MSLSKRRLLIVGAGSLARELASWIRCSPPTLREFEFAGFLDDNCDALAGYPAYYPRVVESVAHYKPQVGDGLLMGISDPKVKLTVGRKMKAAGGEFISFVHPSVIMGQNVQLGCGVTVSPNAVISCDAIISDFVTINLGCTIGHDAVIGAGCTFSAHVDITGFARIGEGVFLGSHASILPRAKVGDYARIGAGTVVLRTVAAGATVMGVPAKQITP